MTQKWDHEADKALLNALAEEFTPTMAHLGRVAERVRPLGYNWTAKAA